VEPDALEANVACNILGSIGEARNQASTRL
jgi:hypothetical protein